MVFLLSLIRDQIKKDSQIGASHHIKSEQEDEARDKYMYGNYKYTLAELKGVQALFCYIADVLGLKKTKTEFAPYIKKIKGADEFFNDYSKIIDRGYTSGEVKTERAKSVVISYIKKSPEWFISSLKIAQYLLDEIDNTISKKFAKIKKEFVLQTW